MLGHQDEIASSYRRTCTDLKEKLKIGLDKIYNTCKDGCQGIILSNAENCLEEILDPLVLFERKLLQYVRIKQEFQTENKNLQIKLKELQLNLQGKNVCILKLKEDIVSHYVQVEFLRNHNENLEEALNNNRKRLAHFEQSEEWLRKHLFPLQTDTNDKPKLISNEFKNQHYQEAVNQLFDEKNRELINFRSGNERKTDCGDENIDGLKKFHLKLIEIHHENIFLKQVIHKMKNITDSEDKLKKLFRTNYDKSTAMKLQHVQEELQIDVSKEEESRREEVIQLNSIIESLRLTVLQLQFEKRNMELSVFTIREYFLKIKDMQRKLKEMLRNNHSVTCTVSESRKIEKKLPTEDRKEILELMNIIRNLKFEKLQMEMEHYDELQSFADKFGNMQYILQNMKTVCDDISEEKELCEKTSIEFENIANKQISEENREPGYIYQKVESKSKNSVDDSPNHGEESHALPHFMTSAILISHDSYKDYALKCKIIPQDIHRRMKLIEEQYKRIVSVCSRNMDILKEIDVNSLISLTGELKLSTSVKDKEIMEEKKRFEKYKRFLLNSVMDYRKSFKMKERQYESLRNLYIPIAQELKRMKVYFCKKENRIFNIEESDDIPNVTQDIDNWTEIIEMHTTSSEPVNHHGSLKIPNTFNGNIRTTPRVDQIEKRFEIQGVIDVRCLEKHKIPSLCKLSEHLYKSENTFDETNQSISNLSAHIDISNSLIEQLKNEKSILQTALRQRDHLLGKIFNSFKRKIEGVAEEITEKYFLQRLCNDLKSAIKVYGCQNKILKEALENNNICTRTIYVQRTLRRNLANNSEDYIRGLLKQQKDYQIQDTFSDIHCRLESMKKDLSLLNVAIKKP